RCRGASAPCRLRRHPRVRSARMPSIYRLPSKRVIATDLPKSLWTTPAVVRMQAEKYGARHFCAFHDGARLSFLDLETQSNALASALAGLGVQPGDRVMALLHNSREFILTMVATHKRKAIFVSLKPRL